MTEDVVAPVLTKDELLTELEGCGDAVSDLRQRLAISHVTFPPFRIGQSVEAKRDVEANTRSVTCRILAGDTRTVLGLCLRSDGWHLQFQRIDALFPAEHFSLVHS